MALTDKLISIADAVRNKTNTTSKLTLDEIPIKIKNIESSTPPILQDKSIEITENGTTIITADNNYDGLNTVIVTTNVASSGGETPEKGFVVNESTTDGYPKEITFFGMTSIPSGFLRYSSSAGTITRYLEKVTLNKEIKTLKTNSFYGLTNLTSVNLDNVEEIGSNAFSGCSNFSTKTMKSIKTLNFNAFNGCTGLTQMSMPNFVGTDMATYGPFNKCTNLKAVWIGSEFSTPYDTFLGYTGVTQIFIDLPRSIVQGLPGYNNLWNAAGATLYCNDDEGFMTQEEFDAIDWATYTG